jgi:phosphatidylethanolamine-binding protein (PEBP) family uncharacterized protein
LILALALAALLLSGCGGGSSDPASSSSTGSSAASASAGQGQGGGGETSATSAQAEKAAGKAKADPKNAPALPGASGAAAAQGQKHGPRIAQPKGAPEQAPTPAEIANATVADMSLESPAIASSSVGEPGTLAATYTCDGKGSWPALHWSGVPAGSAELILYVMNLAPVEGKLFVDWAVAGLDPSLEEIEAGKLPKGAVVGTNGFGKRGYEICPSGGGEVYAFAVYALPRALSPSKGFDARELRKQILDVSGNVGLLTALYTHE